jgi:hypothetical protein
MRIRIIVGLLSLLLLSACRPSGDLVNAGDPTATRPAPVVERTEVRSTPVATRPAATAPVATPVEASPDPTAGPTAEPTAVPTAVASTADALATDPPERDDVRLAVAFRGVVPAEMTPAADEPAPQIGDSRPFYIGNVDDNTVEEIDAVLLAAGEHAYFWFEQDDAVSDPPEDELADVAAAFDAIYESVVAAFAAGAGDRNLAEPVHIVHAQPDTLCVIQPDAGCRLAGYFSSRDMLPRWANPYSNERAMFVMNRDQFDSAGYLPVLAHELRHRVEAEYDNGDEDWAVEGSAMLAEDLLGYPEVAQQRGQLFLGSPDQQLNTWSETARAAHYGQGYLVSRFLYDRLGAGDYRRLAASPESGLAAVDGLGLGVSGVDLWLDWLAAMALVDEPDAPADYRWRGPALEPAAAQPVNNRPEAIEATVSQYAADYYELPSSGTTSVAFAGDQEVALLAASGPIDGPFWYAVRANYSNPRLTRTVDLTGVSGATLGYRVYADIEQGYDFAYVSVSTDGGVTWQPLAAGGMQGLDAADDPSGSALGERYYTGRSRAWLDETIDLTPYAGQVVQLRFEVMTDPILTYDGLAVRDIAIPEIGFTDEGTTGPDGWTAEGFVWTEPVVPQSWHLQLITFDGETPEVTSIPVEADGTAAFEVSALAGERRPVLIVAATAPRTLQAGNYRLDLR